MTLIPSLLALKAPIFFILFRSYSELIKIRTPTVGYSLGMVEIEGSDNRNFIHQTDRVGQTDDTHSITSQNSHSDRGL